ncbi:hypothetical protein Bca4012_026637 [Brassica carinata]
MNTSQISGGDSSSFINNDDKPRSYPPCRCGQPTILWKAWTDDNPGRRYFRCPVHGFSAWSDVGAPHGWHKISLLEARDEINRQKSEIQKLKGAIRALNLQNTNSTASADNFNAIPLAVENSEEFKKLETEALKSTERERLLRQVLIFSWGGFLAATAIIITMSKN